MSKSDARGVFAPCATTAEHDANDSVDLTQLNRKIV